MTKAAIDTGTGDLLAHEEDGVAVITLNRPQARNAMSLAMNGALATVLDRAERDAAIRCVVLTGAGGAFCAGGDVKGMAARGGAAGGPGPSLDERIHDQRLNQRSTAGRMYLMPKPVLASLPGPAAGAGLSLALSADLRIMADSAFITTAFARVGFSGDYGGSFFLSNLVGSGKAKELYFLSDRVGADECLQLGIANRVVPAARLEAETMALARRLASGPTRRLPVHEGELQPCGHGRQRRRVPRPGSDAPCAYRPDGGPSQRGPGFRGETAAGVQREIVRKNRRCIEPA